jgi:uncharacterized membrane protein YuzA (DUF378 family)
MKNISMISHILLIVSGINVGLGLLDMDVVGMALGSVPLLGTIFAGLVGVSGLYGAYMMLTGKGCSK